MLHNGFQKANCPHVQVDVKAKPFRGQLNIIVQVCTDQRGHFPARNHDKRTHTNYDTHTRSYANQRSPDVSLLHGWRYKMQSAAQKIRQSLTQKSKHIVVMLMQIKAGKLRNHHRKRHHFSLKHVCGFLHKHKIK
ncbi:15.7 kDa hypothetical protein [Human adenovirus 57]|nr:15.7 kDa hypothetical protein [Human adenovirus 57]